jgi:hypothetical protein
MDLITAIPALYHQLLLPVSVIMLLTGAVSGAFSLHKGVGKAAGKVIGGIALAALTFGGLGLTHALQNTVNIHGGPVLVDTGM